MSKRTILLGVALGFCFALSGCGGASTDGDAAPNSNAPAAVESDASDVGEGAAPLNVEDAESPEGVVDAFFRSFFKGDDDGAFALLTSKAQEATANNFPRKPAIRSSGRRRKKNRSTMDTFAFTSTSKI
ncbi:MAG: hypothetical protein IJX36_03645, partial [Thermoguttaceae bacterium]|nr:hypothetical protein [Thermoguttaceae bacterium]